MVNEAAFELVVNNTCKLQKILIYFLKRLGSLPKSKILLPAVICF